MKKFFQNIFSKSSAANQTKKKAKEFTGKQGDCQKHNIISYPNIKANEECFTCNQKSCYICSYKHFEQRCDIKWTDTMNQFRDKITPLNEDNMLFNRGHIAKLKLKELYCPCGTELQGDNNSGICVACGTATCSTLCHDKYMKDENKCLFHYNFTQNLQETQSMRSILFSNIHQFYKKGYAQGTPVSKTSSNLIQGYLGKDDGYIYLQRGFRQYGQPLQLTQNNMEVQKERNIDQHIFQNRACDCECMVCSNKDLHPIFNCDIYCRSRDGQIYQNIMQDENYKVKCQCNCKFCNSGILNLSHRKGDCIQLCLKSGYNQSQEI